ncbi:MAG: S8 family serine peptidase [Bacteroidales bacterium]|nr:S8 family serine peptidase [Bacteroidales bacterium]
MRVYGKYLLLVWLLVVSALGHGQTAYYYYVQFTDKDSNTYSLSHPEQFLSQRALDRRTRQGIAITENDLPVSQQYLLGIAATGVTLLNPTKWLNGVTIETTDTNQLAQIRQKTYVLTTRLIKTGSIKKAFFTHESVSGASSDQNKSAAAETGYDYGYAATQIDQIKGTGLHDSGYRGQKMVIAVLDAGYLNVPRQIVFDSLRAEGRLLGTRDFVHPGGSVYVESDHGRMVLSCMAADDPGLMIGTAPKASYWLLHTEDVTSESVLEEYNWVSGAEFADSVGADIINSSLGYTTFNDTADSYTYADMNGKTAVSTLGAEIAASKGILVVNSAGNSGGTSEPWVGAPADGDSVFTIGAVNGAGYRASFSSTGPTYDGRIKPTVMAMGELTTVADADTGVLYGNGTSFSSPIIAGMSACLWQAHPKASNMQIIQSIKETASLHNDPNNQMGWGIPDFSRADSMLTILTTVETNQKLPFEWNVFPNPFQGDVILTLNRVPVKGQVVVSLFNLLGQKVVEKSFVLSGSFGEYKMKGLGDIPSGYYVLSVRMNRWQIHTKILKSH